MSEVVNPFGAFRWQGRSGSDPPAKRLRPPPPGLDPYWDQRLRSLGKSASLEMAALLNRNNALGVPGRVRGAFMTFVLEQKQRHPTCVLLVRKGDFYEAMGVDAIMLVEHTQVNPHRSRATQKIETVMTGVPRSNLHSTLERLVAQGLRVAVYEEMRSGLGVSSRELAQVVSSCNPNYVHGKGPLPPHFGEGRPLVGVRWSELGHTMYEVCITARTVQEWSGLSTEVLHARMQLRSPLVLYTKGVPAPVVKQYRHLEVVSLDGYEDFRGTLLRHVERELGVSAAEFQHAELSRQEPAAAAAAAGAAPACCPAPACPRWSTGWCRLPPRRPAGPSCGSSC